LGVHITLHSSRHFVLTIFHGSVSDHELEAFVEELLLDKYDRDKGVRLAILSEGASSSRLSYHALYAAGRRMRQCRFRQRHGKLAIIAGKPVDFGLAKVYQIATKITDHDEIKVLHKGDLTSAAQWLGISDLSENIQQIIKSVEQSAGEGLSIQAIH